MGSKLPTDGESQSQLLGSEGRQLRSRLVEVCNLCQKPLPTAAAKSTASHIHCTCVTPPNTTGAAAASAFASSMSPRKKKVSETVEVAESSKRQLFKDPIIKSSQQLVEAAAAAAAAAATAAAAHCVARASSSTTTTTTMTSSTSAPKIEIKSEDENTASTTMGSLSRKSESKSRHVCSVCSKCFNTPGKLNQHMFSHTGEKPFVCNHCSKAFSSKFKLVRHILIHSDLRQYRCTVCERTFHRKDHLKNHSKVHSPVKRRFKCDRSDCSKEYSSILSYRKHMAVHSAEEGNLECKICGKKFENKEETLFHLKVHAGSRSLKTPADRKYHCDHCDRSFFTGKDVRRHLVVHTGRRDFLCQYCPQRFGRKDHLTRHIKKSHSNSSKKSKTRRCAATATVATIGTAATTEVTGELTSKAVGNILQEMFEKKLVGKKEDEEEEAGAEAVAEVEGEEEEEEEVDDEAEEEEGVVDAEDLYKLHGIDSPMDVTKLESSPDIIPIVTIDEKGSLPTKVEDTVSLYGMPMLHPANIPFPKFEQYHPFENFQYEQTAPAEMAGPSTSHTVGSPMMYQQQSQPQQPPPPYPAQNEEVKAAREEYTAENEATTMNLVLPPITNISSSIGTCMLSNADLQNLLLPSTPGDGVEEADNNANGSRIADQLLNFLPSSNELLESLLSSASDDTNPTRLPGFSQAFQQPP